MMCSGDSVRCSIVVVGGYVCSSNSVCLWRVWSSNTVMVCGVCMMMGGQWRKTERT